MLCAACGVEAPTEMARCAACGQSPILISGGRFAGESTRYRLDSIVGRGAFGVTYRAARLDDNLVVCIKELSYRKMGSFEIEKGFRREAQILRELAHPQIPRYIDDFLVESGKNVAAYIVQEFVDGESLKDELAHKRYREADVLAILDDLLGILEDLHELRPPVIHRDIKPGNALRRASDGRMVLVDFGSVKDAFRDPNSGGSTIAGTYGYMPPEQFYGQANAASDLYSLGVLAVVLLTRQEPQTMMDDAHHLNWHSCTEVSSGFRELLDELLVPDCAQRPHSAKEVRERVRGLLRGDADLAAPTVRGVSSGANPTMAKSGSILSIAAVQVVISLVLLGIAFIGAVLRR